MPCFDPEKITDFSSETGKTKLNINHVIHVFHNFFCFQFDKEERYEILNVLEFTRLVYEVLISLVL